VLKRINVALRCFLDKITVKHLPPILVVLEPPGADLDSVAHPIRSNARQPTHYCAGQSSERRDDRSFHERYLTRSVQRWPNLSANVMTVALR
jgi:hypothetical protein